MITLVVHSYVGDFLYPGRTYGTYGGSLVRIQGGYTDRTGGRLVYIQGGHTDCMRGSFSFV